MAYQKYIPATPFPVVPAFRAIFFVGFQLGIVAIMLASETDWFLRRKSKGNHPRRET